jgi:hypothetical protein
MRDKAGGALAFVAVFSILLDRKHSVDKPICPCILCAGIGPTRSMHGNGCVEKFGDQAVKEVEGNIKRSLVIDNLDCPVAYMVVHVLRNQRDEMRKDVSQLAVKVKENDAVVSVGKREPVA